MGNSTVEANPTSLEDLWRDLKMEEKCHKLPCHYRMLSVDSLAKMAVLAI